MAEVETKTPYRVLARKYRPQHFDDLIGQDVLVRTLKNAIEGGRIAHAFMLTGIRGVGKTTTARIIARALNYTGSDGKSGPTTGPTDDCTVCRAISEDRHPDILEMDAASRTGVNDIRDILDGVRYAPASARYKIYIIDEVHMLSASAFNALLKTLEEPPEHVKFIFATTEIRKVPVTVLSRCQRFDLRRVEPGILRDHYKRICELESVDIDEEALNLIARAADGSVRDGLSLLDQAMALSTDGISAVQVAGMLGLSDRSRSLALLEEVLSGQTGEALSIMEDLYKCGADPVILIQDLIGYIHVLSRIKVVPDVPARRLNMDSESYAKVAELAGKLSMPVLGRAWQILLKGLEEMGYAPNPQAAAEMLVIRLGYAANLPDPSTLVRKLKEGKVPASKSYANPDVQENSSPAGNGVASSGNATTATAFAPRTSEQTSPEPAAIEEVVDLLMGAGEHVLAGQVFHYVHPVKISPGRLEIALEEGAPAVLSQNLGKALSKICGRRWIIMVSAGPGGATLAEKEKKKEAEELRKIYQLPMVKEIISLFPGAEVVNIHKETTKELET